MPTAPAPPPSSSPRPPRAIAATAIPAPPTQEELTEPVPVRQAEPPPRSEGVGMLGAAAAVAALILLGMLFGAALWLYAAYAAIGLLLGTRVLARLWSESAHCTRHTGPLEVEVGRMVPIQIEIENRGRLPILWLLVEDLLPRSALMHKPPALEVTGSRLRVMLIAPGRRQSVTYRLQCNRRGYYQIGPTVLETGDLLGLHRRYRVGATPQYLLVMPRVVPLAGYDVASRRPIGEIRISDILMADPTRIRGIRAWQPGDPMRQVHWAATARTGTLHSKVYEPTTVAGVTLVLDLHRDTNPARHEPVRSELAITFAASVAAAMYQMNQPLALATNGRDAADRIRTEGWSGDFRTRTEAKQQLAMREADARLRPVILPADRGPVHQDAFQRQLARLELTDGLTLVELLIEAQPRLSHDTTLMIVVQKIDAAAAAWLISMARRGWSVAVVVNTYDINDFAAIAGPLIAAGLTVLHLRDDDQVAETCRRVILR